MISSEYKLEKIKKYLSTMYIKEDDYCDNIHEYTSNLNDAYDLGYDYGSSDIVKLILRIINEE